MITRDMLRGLARGGAVLMATACVVAGALAQAFLSSQPTSSSPLAPPPNGPRQAEPADGLLALTGATVHLDDEKVIERGVVVVRSGRIEAVGAMDAVSIPRGAGVRDATGLHVYPGFIEPWLEIDVPRPELGTPGTHWNKLITPQRTALDKGDKGVDAKTVEQLRSMGFVAAGICPKGGILRGTGAVIGLGDRSADPSKDSPRVYAKDVYQGASFETVREDDGPAPGGASGEAWWGGYPDSQMGAIALLRQTLLDSDWHESAKRSQPAGAPADALDALARTRSIGGKVLAGAKVRSIPLLIDVNDELEGLRADAIAEEFSREVIVLGSGLEFRRLRAMAPNRRGYVLPLTNLPAPKVDTIGKAESVALEDLLNWEQAPTNPRRVDALGMTVALTTGKVPDKMGGRGGFRDRLGTAIKHGLKPERALRMLTHNAAVLLNVDDQLGSIAPGKLASFIVTDGPLFTDRPDAPGKDEPGYVRPGRIIDVYVEGRKHTVNPRERRDLSGRYALTITPAPGLPELAKDATDQGFTLEIDDELKVTIERVWKTGAGDNPKVTTAKAKARSVDIDEDGRISFVYEGEGIQLESGTITVSGLLERGTGDHAQDITLTATARRSGQAAGAWRGSRTGDVPTLPGAAWAGTWVVLVNGEPVKSDDKTQPRVSITPQGEVSVKRGDKDLEVKDAKVTEKEVSFSVPEFAPVDDKATKVWLTKAPNNPTKALGRTAENGPPIVELAPSRATKETDAIKAIPEKLVTPLGPYGLEEIPAPKVYVLENATVWTSDDARAGEGSVIKNGAVVLSAGQIVFVGAVQELGDFLARTRFEGELVRMDLKGKHITPGIIDCHSHTGISKGVNEGGQAVTAEVRIADVTDPDSVSWYRQLAGGVTTVNSLHGSANAIGGQSQVNKNRWGATDPKDLHFLAATPGIKFALGENPKQSNWGDRAVNRYPQTRMGVETIIRDRFTAAREYAKARAAGGDKVRRDLELDALAEVLAGTRLVHCHSYRQDEILMLAKISEEFGFTIGTYQHGLECYKVAESVKVRAIGASIFADWWAYKVEVQDAIPQAGPILFEQGVNVSYNSDSDEMARRLNVEAGKAVKYSGGTVKPADALKFVTINPAKQLKIDQRVGSLVVGKDADVAVWSGPPLSSLSRCEMTFVDGRLLFSLEMDKKLRARDRAERERLIQKILAQSKPDGGAKLESKGGEAPAAKPTATEAPASTDAPPKARDNGRTLLIQGARTSAADLRREHFLRLIKVGLDPRFFRSGDCGCDEWMYRP